MNTPITLGLLQERVMTAREQITQLDPSTLNIADTRAAWLGKKQGTWTNLAKLIPQLPPEHRGVGGQMVQTLRGEIESVLDQAIQTQAAVSQLDPSMPAPDLVPASVHPVSQAIFEISGIFERIGFTRVRYPEVDWDWYAFTGLNMPQNHPARDEWETFFVDLPADPEKGRVVLTPHTSNGQVREMERLKSQPPIRMMNIGRTYRRQQDATHVPMFHQFEGLVVDKNISLQHLKGTIEHFTHEFFGPTATFRLRPFHFQFTEPSFEVDFSCTICNGTGVLPDSGTGQAEKCRFCKSGWHEVGGAGMVHPNVLKAGGIDPTEYSGFAFGWGVERTYALRPGLHIDDVRLYYGNDPRFLSQFA